MKTLIGSVDRVTGTTAYIILNDDEHVLQIPAELLPDGAAEGSRGHGLYDHHRAQRRGRTAAAR